MADVGFRWRRSNGYEVPSRITDVPGTTSETFTKGEALAISTTGTWTKAANGVAVAGFSEQSKTCTASDNSLSVVEARADDVFEAPYTGTPAAGFVVGANTVDVSADGLSVLSSDVTGGPFAVMSINTGKLTCKVRVKSRQLS